MNQTCVRPAAPRPLDLQREDLPDPTVLTEPDGYYCYATNNRHANVPVVYSPDLSQFTLLGDALPTLPRWAHGGFTWAPEVTRLCGADGRLHYVLYFTARERGTAVQVIGVAVAGRPEGPFTASPAPLLRMADLGGAIDPAVLISGGARYLYWKNDGNAVGEPTWLWGAPLREDGLGLACPPVRLLAASEPWERELIEAPQVIEDGGTFHLLYSCADFGSDTYAVGHACGPTPLGPFTKTVAAPLLASHGTLAGPGHSHAFRDAQGQWRLAYHAWQAGRVGYPHGRRGLVVSPLTLRGRVARVG